MPNCPECNTPNAYVGFFVVECLNPQCRHYVCAHGASGQSGQAFVNSSQLPPEIQAAVDDIMTNGFPREVESIQEAVGAPIPVTMDFRNAAGDLKAVWLLFRVLQRVRTTLCLSSSLHQEQLKAGIQRVAIRHTTPGERKSCTLAQGVLDMIVCLDDQKTHVGPDGAMVYDENDITKMVADALDLELGPAVRRLQEWLLGCIAEFNEDLRLHLKLDVDWKSFTSNPDNAVNLRVIGRLEQEFHQNILYWLRSHAANNKEFRKQLKNVLHSVRVEHAASAAQRELYVDGATIVYRLCITEDGGAWGYELGDVLMSAVMSVQPPPKAEDVQEWLGEHGAKMQQQLAEISDAGGRTALERFLQRDLPAVALRIHETAGYPLGISLDWEYLSRHLDVVPRLIPRVLNRICGALALVAKNESHEALLQEGAVEDIEISLTNNPAEKVCQFQAPTLCLTVCVEQPGAGCFDENEMANTINQRLAIDAKLAEIKDVVPDTAKRLCDALGSWIDIEVEWEGFLDFPEPGKVVLAQMELGEVGLGWIYYALTGQCEESPDFKAKLRDRVRAVRFIHISNPKEKSITAEGSTLVYRLHLHIGHDGRFIIDHLKEIFEEVVETMEPHAPVSQTVVTEFERCEREEVAPVVEKLAKLLGHEVSLRVGREGFGNNLNAVRALNDSALSPIVEALADLARDKDLRKQLVSGVKTITIRNINDSAENKCTLKDGELLIETCLESGGSDALSMSDIYNTLQECLGDSDEDEEEDEEEEKDEDENESEGDSDESNAESQSDDGNDPAAYLKRYRKDALEKFIEMLNQMNGTTMLLDGDWDAFEAQLNSPARDNVQACVFNRPQLFLSMLMQLQMMNPPFGVKLKKDVKIVRFACARPEQPKDIKLDGGVLTCRIKPEDGMAGGFDQAELFAKLQQVLA